MEFHETGLPLEQTVYKAYMLYKQNASVPETAPLRDHFPLRVTRVLQDADEKDPLLLSLPLLLVLPPQLTGLVERRFGSGMADLLKETYRHQMTDFAYIVHGSANAKLATVASAIATLEEFLEDSSKTDMQLDAIESGMGSKEMVLPFAGDMTIYDRLLHAIAGKTPSAKLEFRLADTVEEARIVLEKQKSRLHQLGLGHIVAEMEEMEKGGPVFTLPSFEETGLMDHPLVRQAYDIVTSDTRVIPEDFEAALQVGRLLGSVPPVKDPGTVAAGLLDVAIRMLHDDDMEALQERLDPAVMMTLMSGSVYKVDSGAEVMKAPVAFRQIALANAIVLLEEARRGGEDIVAAVALDPEMKDQKLRAHLAPVARIGFMMNKTFQPVMGTTDAPALEQLFEESLRRVQKFVAEHMPQKKEQGPGPTKKPEPPFSPWL